VFSVPKQKETLVNQILKSTLMDVLKILLETKSLDIDSSIHKFYNEHKVIGSDEQNVYLKVLSMAALSINVGLSLLGIKAREIM